MTHQREHAWGQPNFFSAVRCKACGLPKASASKMPCKGLSVTEQTPAAFRAIERAVVDYFDATLPRRAATLEEAGEWYAEIMDYRISLSALSLAIAQQLSRAA